MAKPPHIGDERGILPGFRGTGFTRKIQVHDLHQQLALFQTYHNFCLPHASLRQPLPQPVPTNGTGSAKRWQPQTPAMAAGLTDHVWSLREVLLFPIPPWSQPAGG